MSSFIPVLFLCFVFSWTVSCQNTTGTTSATTVGSACSSDPCSNGGTCLDIPNGYICNCEFGYTGQQCNTDVDECTAISPCENGGRCTNTLGSYYCDCQPGYSGNVCQIDSVTAAPLPPVVNLSTTSAPTVPTAAPQPNVAIGCASSPCKNRGVCLDTATGYTCKCAPGFFGNTCDTEIDECASSPCQHKATCVDQINGFTCICQAGWNGTLCQNNIDECVGVTCQHGGTCVDGVNSYTCNCQYGYSGTSCETRIDVDDCRSNPCQHGGTCIDGHFSYTCRCNDYYKGANCQTACHSVKADIMMLLDSSGSVGSTNFHKQLSFVQSVAQSFDIGPNNVHMGVVTFSTAPHSQFDLNHYTNKQTLIYAINKIPYQSGSTHTDSAIDYLINHSFTSRHGDRTGAPNIAVIITDGHSNNRQATIKEANLLHSRGITTVAIGVGSGINPSELKAIASNQSLVFTVPNYGALHTIQGLIDHRICQVHLMHTTQPSTTVYYPTPPSINEVKCEDKLANCYRYGVAACDSFRQWASDNCPKYCQFCKVSGGGAPTFSPIIG